MKSDKLDPQACLGVIRKAIYDHQKRTGWPPDAVNTTVKVRLAIAPLYPTSHIKVAGVPVFTKLSQSEHVLTE